MASSGNIIASGDIDGRTIRLDWSIIEPSTAGNYTDISYTIKGTGGGIVWQSCQKCKCVIDGRTVFNQTGSVKLYNGTELKRGTLRIYHDSNGAKTFSASLEAAIYYSTLNVSGKGTWSLPTIPKEAKITKAANFNDEQNLTVEYKVEATPDSLQMCIADTSGDVVHVPYRDVSKTGNKYTFNFTAAERKALRKACTGKTLQVKIYLKTVLGGVKYYSRKEVTFSIINGAPSLPDATYKDQDTTITGITENDQIIIQNMSNLQLKINAATAKKEATIKKYRLEVLDFVAERSIAGTVNVGQVNSQDNVTYKLTVTDSRGFETTRKGIITMIGYAPPWIKNFTAQRQCNYYEETNVEISADYYACGGKNQIECKLKIEDFSGNSNEYVIANNSTQVFTLANDKIHVLTMTVIDTFGNSASRQINLAKGTPVLVIDAKNRRVGINKIPLKDLDVDGDIQVTKSFPDGTIDTRLILDENGANFFNKISIMNDIVATIKQEVIGIWNVWKIGNWGTGKTSVVAWARVQVTLEHYGTEAGFYKYKYNAKFPTGLFTSRPAVEHTWGLGTGFAFPARTETSVTETTVYALSTGSGSKTAYIYLLAVGEAQG